MFNMLYQYSQISSARRAAEIWLPSDTAPTQEWFPLAYPNVAPDSELARWENEGGNRG